LENLKTFPKEITNWKGSSQTILIFKQHDLNTQMIQKKFLNTVNSF
jgi:hypothetical protein